MCAFDVHFFLILLYYLYVVSCCLCVINKQISVVHWPECPKSKAFLPSRDVDCAAYATATWLGFYPSHAVLYQNG